MRNIHQFVVTVILCGGLVGCAADKELRQDTKFLSIYIEKVKSDAVEFSDARDRVMKARTSTLNYLQAKTLRDEQSIQRDLSAREVAQDKEWLTLFGSLRKAADLIAKQRQEQRDRDAEASDALAKAKGAVEVKGNKLTEASTALATLSEERSRRDDAKFFFSFLKQVNEELEKKKGDAKAAAAASATASELKTVPTSDLKAVPK